MVGIRQTYRAVGTGTSLKKKKIDTRSKKCVCVCMYIYWLSGFIIHRKKEAI